MWELKILGDLNILVPGVQGLPLSEDSPKVSPQRGLFTCLPPALRPQPSG